ncbi:homeobox-leucine zipper protein MERISTEM L1-like isoform X1 [Cucurbita moschata]|uniref:Homeobox-leucine zipper protein MERISTEM L1-like isoform X1 n=1 Tax=Cucurbita moschata TaxID=3662 RepID=A0A6J1FS89_CUCMO|nr:homeobox-leucine zipper protein MERISTEM L1-like isoform X1 [Cucurbita moschata]
MDNNYPQYNEGAGSSHTSNSPQCASNFNIFDQSASNSNSNVKGNELHRASDLLMAVSVCTEANFSRIADLADTAMDELIKAALDGDPLWMPQQNEEAESYYTLLDIMKMVEVGEPPSSSLLDFDLFNTKSDTESNINNNTNLGFKDNQQQQQHYLQTEFSRQTEFVKVDPLSIVGFLMDLEQWSLVFSDIVSRAAILQMWSSMGPGGTYDGTLQVMTAEFQLASPLVETRESYFGRFCKQLAPYTWGVVDISLEDLFPYPSIGFCRKPSGCLIQACPDGISKVMWVEHVEVDNRCVQPMFQPYINSGLAFGAKRWVSSLVRHCIWLTTLEAKSTSTINGDPGLVRHKSESSGTNKTQVSILQAGRLSVLKLAERMTRTFYNVVSGSKENPWMKIPIPGPHDIRVMTQKAKENDPGRPPCTSVIFATSAQVPNNPNEVFQFLRHEKSRNKWDILSFGYVITELACIINGNDSRNRVSIIQVNSSPRKVEIFYLQESYFDATGSYIVYAPVDLFAMSILLRGGNPDNVAILSSGFVVLPDNLKMNGQEVEADGSIVTVALNIVDHSITERIPFDSMVSMHRIMNETVASIKQAFQVQQF